MGLELGEFTVIRVTADEIGTAERADTNVRPQTPASWPEASRPNSLAVLVVPSFSRPALLKNPARAISPLRSAKPSPKNLEPVHFSGLAAYALGVPQSPQTPHRTPNNP